MNDEHPRDAAADGASSSADRASELSAVGALMEERRQYESWLAALDERRTDTPEHVFTRVHADYTARLDSVIARLVSHADGMRAELTALTAKLATLDEQEHRARDERAEAELRAHVGELTPDAWDAFAATSDAALAALTAQRADTEEDLSRTRELLADAERPPTPVAAAAPVPSPAPAEIAMPLAPVADVAEAALHVPSAEARPAETGEAQHAPPPSGFDELAFLQSVVDTSASGSPAPEAAAAPAPETPPIQPSATAASVPPAPLNAPAPRREPFAARRPEPPPAERIVKQGEGAAPTIRPRFGAEQSLAANISGNNPIILRDKTVEAAKTLKCAECGAMNYPTEWYCERCGAELASM